MTTNQTGFQFITNGPRIPLKLLFEHQQNNVVFFCGAGLKREPNYVTNYPKTVIRLFERLFKNTDQKNIRSEEEDLNTLFKELERYISDDTMLIKKLSRLKQKLPSEI